MYRNHFKKTVSLIMTGMLICTLSACRTITEKRAEEQTTEITKVKQNNPDYVQEDVILPEDFGNMIYPMEALMVEEYKMGLPYYNEESTEEESESFWYSMAVLANQMNQYVRDVVVETADQFIYIDEETTDIYASAMFDEYARGNLEFPELGEDSPWAAYNSEKGLYGFRQGRVKKVEPYVTECKQNKDEYVLTVHLKEKDSVEILSSYEIVIVPTVLENEENIFSYSIKDFHLIEKAFDFDSTAEDTEEAEETTMEEEKTEETSEVTEETTETTTETSTQAKKTSGANDISTEEALDLAKDYYGEDAQYNYKDIVTIGDYDYYDFSVEGDDGRTTDILISLDGENVMGGTQNSDGSWSFDQ